MPQMIPLLILMLVHVFYEESDPPPKGNGYDVTLGRHVRVSFPITWLFFSTTTIFCRLLLLLFKKILVDCSSCMLLAVNF